MHVVDTDYKNYMITYWCHEEYRMPVEGTDDLTKYWEDYRTFKEEGRKREKGVAQAPDAGRQPRGEGEREREREREGRIDG